VKSRRHAKILELVDKYDIETQEELAERLNENGFSVTQATISRDIRELKLSKVSGSSGRQKYAAFIKPTLEMTDKYSRVLKEGYVSKEVATSLIVIKTVTGMAMAVAVAIDHMELPGVVGCIAGDDTIMCAIRSVDDTILVMDRLKKIIAGDDEN
jgi:transcriptional regulator of arginine metabolism